MKEKDIRKSNIEKVSLLDQVLGGVTSFTLDGDAQYNLAFDTGRLSDEQLERLEDVTLTFQFSTHGVVADILLRAVVREGARVRINIVVKAMKGIQNVQSGLDMRALLLGKDASITFVPALEIDEKEVMVDHRSSIGALPVEIIRYMESRGVSGSELTELVASQYMEETGASTTK